MLNIEEDMMPRNYCGNCLGTNRVRFDHASGRRLCIECEPNPLLSESPRAIAAWERRSGNERRSVPRWIEWTRENERRGKALDHS